MRKNKCTISIDWLQVLCRKSDNRTDTSTFFVSPNTNEYGNHNTYIARDAQEWTAGYNYHRTIFLNKIAIAHISWCPKRENIDPNNCSVKLSNNLLYTNQWHFILGDLTRALGWQVKSITRLDIACDFNHFLHGLNPELFIRRYIRNKQDSYIRTLSNKFCLVGEKNTQNTRIDYIRWGSRTSGVCTYLYNKSKEMRDCKMKPWIIERWRGAGLNVKNVWRVEFSINSSGRGLKDIEQGIIHNLFVDDIETQERLIQIFHTYAKRYFNFRHIKKDGQKYVKDMKNVELLDTAEALKMIPCQLYTATRKSSTIQNCIQMIEQLNDNIPSHHSKEEDEQKKHLTQSSIYLTTILQRAYNLEQRQESITDHLKARIKSHIDRMTYNETMLRYNSFMSNEDYKEDVCARTALRITKLLLSRKGNKLHAYSA